MALTMGHALEIDSHIQAALANSKRQQESAQVIQAGGNGELDVYLQPIVLLQTKQVVSFEALIRRIKDGKPIGSAEEIVEAAAAYDLSDHLWIIVMRKVCQLLAGLPHDIRLPVAINASPRQMSSFWFAETARELAHQYGVEPRLIRFELTEREPILDNNIVISVLRRLESFGFDVMIDDFGSGHTTLSMLSALPVSGIKFDRNFLKTNNPARRIILDGVVNICHMLDRFVVIEGIETEALHDIA